MRERMPAHVWDDWLWYAKREPFGEERADLRAGIIASVVANTMGRKKGQSAFKPKDFIPRFTPRKAKTPDVLFDKIKVLTSLMGGTFVDNRET